MGRVRMVVREVAIHLAEQLRHLAAHRAEQLRRKGACHTVAAVHGNLHRAAQLDVRDDSVDVLLADVHLDVIA